MERFKVEWQRLVESGETCSRCGNTEQELEAACEHLTRALGELGLEVVLEKEELDPEVFEQEPLESNRIWIAGKPLEDILGATVSHSLCCDLCGENQCRTLKWNGEEFETIPRELIIKGGLRKAANLVEPKAAGGCCEDDCCCSD